MEGFANPVRGEVELRLGEHCFVLRPSFEALVQIEEEIGSLFALVERASTGSVLFKDIVTVLWFCARASDRVVKQDAFGAMIVANGVAPASAAFVKILSYALRGPE